MMKLVFVAFFWEKNVYCKSIIRGNNFVDEGKLRKKKKRQEGSGQNK